jgi:hypothetical protein
MLTFGIITHWEAIQRVMAAKLARLTHKIAIQLHLVQQLYHLQFSLQAASSETFGHTVVYSNDRARHSKDRGSGINFSLCCDREKVSE